MRSLAPWDIPVGAKASVLSKGPLHLLQIQTAGQASEEVSGSEEVHLQGSKETRVP